MGSLNNDALNHVADEYRKSIPGMENMSNDDILQVLQSDPKLYAGFRADYDAANAALAATTPQTPFAKLVAASRQAMSDGSSALAGLAAPVLAPVLAAANAVGQASNRVGDMALNQALGRGVGSYVGGTERPVTDLFSGLGSAAQGVVNAIPADDALANSLYASGHPHLGDAALLYGTALGLKEKAQAAAGLVPQSLAGIAATALSPEATTNEPITDAVKGASGAIKDRIAGAIAGLNTAGDAAAKNYINRSMALFDSIGGPPPETIDSGAAAKAVAEGRALSDWSQVQKEYQLRNALSPSTPVVPNQLAAKAQEYGLAPDGVLPGLSNSKLRSILTQSASLGDDTEKVVEPLSAIDAADLQKQLYQAAFNARKVKLDTAIPGSSGYLSSIYRDLGDATGEDIEKQLGPDSPFVRANENAKATAKRFFNTHLDPTMVAIHNANPSEMFKHVLASPESVDSYIRATGALGDKPLAQEYVNQVLSSKNPEQALDDIMRVSNSRVMASKILTQEQLDALRGVVSAHGEYVTRGPGLAETLKSVAKKAVGASVGAAAGSTIQVPGATALGALTGEHLVGE